MIESPSQTLQLAYPPQMKPGEESGPVSKLPWENLRRFREIQLQTDTQVLMAGYRTVLKDPLPGEEENVRLAAQLLSGTVIPPGGVFSQNQTIGPYTEERGFQKGPTYVGTWLTTTTGGGVCKIASTLYNVSILCNLPVIERHSHSMPVPYVPYGQDATVSYGTKDFRFQNNLDHPLLIWAEGVGNTLYIAFYGRESPPRVEWHHQVLKQVKAARIYRYNDNLEPGTEKTVLEGMDGGIIQSWVTVYDSQGQQTKMLSKSYYSPMPTIIEKSRISPALSPASTP